MDVFITYGSCLTLIRLTVVLCALHVPNIIDGNVQLHVLSHTPDNFQGVTDIVPDGLPKQAAKYY